MGNKTYTITEYQSFSTKDINSNCVVIPQKVFDSLEQFILSNNEKLGDVMKIAYTKHSNKVITCQNYVGIISMNDGTNIEILPKIYGEPDNSIKISDLRKIFVNMVASINNMPFKNFQSANLSIDNVNLLEIFIKMFLNQTHRLVIKGLKNDYETIQENENFIKGRILFKKQFENNLTHKERNYVEYDVFSLNRPENKLIKSTLLLLKKKTSNVKNKGLINNLLVYFDAVDESINYEDDFIHVKIDRDMVDYIDLIKWCKIFLYNKSFSTFVGSNIVMSLLFPMDKLFESYIALKLKQYLNKSIFSVTSQDSSLNLFDNSNSFSIRPDIVIRNKISNEKYIMDTKWKMLNYYQRNHGIVQSDMYQMYVYNKKFMSKNVTLLYPCTEHYTYNDNFQYIERDGAIIYVCFINLLDLKSSFNSIFNLIGND